LRYLDHIKPIEKQAILLCDLHDCTYQQAANILNLKLNTLKSHLTRGRKKMREILTKEETNESI
jgi:RNA polymerase sigma-70 factor, ECF subfamily